MPSNYWEHANSQRDFAIFGLIRSFKRGSDLRTLLKRASALVIHVLSADNCVILESQRCPATSTLFTAPGTETWQNGQMKRRSNKVFETTRGKHLDKTVVAIPGTEGVVGHIEVTRSKQCLSQGDLRFLNNLGLALGILIEHGRLRDERQQIKELHRFLLEGSEKVLLYEHDLNHIVTYISRSSSEIIGYSPGEMIGRPAEDFQASESSKALAVELTDAAMRNGVAGPRYLSVLRHKTGNEVIVETIEAPIRTSGEVVGMQGIARDVTERHLTERHLRRRTAHLQSLLVHNPLGIIVLDAQDRIEMCNPAFEKIFGYKQDEIKGLDLDRLIGQGDLRAEARDLTRQAKSGTVVHASAFRSRKDGTRVAVEIYSLPLVVEDETVGSFAIYQDMTERRVAEESVKLLSGRLLQVQDEERRRISQELHDTTVQTLAALAMRLGALCKSCSDALSPSELAGLIENAELAEDCARELRTLSYLLHPPLLDEAGIGSATNWYAEGFSKRTAIRVRVRISSRMQRLSHDMEMTLFRIIQESLSNAYKHSGARNVTIRLWKKTREVHLEITDDGDGISAATLKSLEATDGTMGMGIAGMRERVKQFGGSLKIIGLSGTTVRVVMPIESANL